MPILKLIFAFSSVFDWIAGALGELAVKFFDMIGNSLIEACTLQESFTATYSKLLFDSSEGLFREAEGATNFFTNTDPTSITTAAALGLVMGLVIWQMFKSLFGNYLQAEDPARILFKGLLYSLLISTYSIWTNGILKLVFSPLYKSFADVSTAGASANSTNTFFADLFTAVSNDTNPVMGALADYYAGISFVSMQLVKSVVLLILMFPIGIKFIQLALEIIERFLQIFFVVIFGPLCLACGVSPAWSAPAQKWFHIYINGMVGLILNIFGIKLSLLALQNFIYNFSSVTSTLGKTFIQYIAVYALFKISAEFDNIQNKLGFDTLSAGGLGIGLFQGLKMGSRAVLGNGNGHGGVARDSINNAAKNGNSTAGAISALNKRGGLVAGAAALGMTLGTRTGRAAIGASAAKAGFKNVGKAASTKGFAEYMSNRSANQTKGSLDGGEMKNATGFFNNLGFKGECIGCTIDKNGNMKATMQKEDGSTYAAFANADGDTQSMTKNCPKGYSIMSGEDENGNRWAMAVPESEVTSSASQEANAGSGTNATAAEVVAGNNVQTGPMEENKVLQNNADAPLNGSSTNAMYTNNGSEQGSASGYAELAVDDNGNLISCDENGDRNPSGNYLLTADGDTVAKQDLAQDENGNVATFSNVGSQLMYNKDDGTIGMVSREDAANGHLPSDFNSWATDCSSNGNVSAIRTQSESMSIDSGETPTAVSMPTSGTNVVADTLQNAAGNAVVLGAASYAYSAEMMSGGAVESESGHQIQTVADSSSPNMAKTQMVTDASGQTSCKAQARIYADEGCTIPQTAGATGGYIKTGNNTSMSLENAVSAGITDDKGRFSINTGASNVSKSVQLYSSDGRGGYTPMSSAQAIQAHQSGTPVFALDGNNSFQQVKNSNIESVVTPTKTTSANGASSFTVKGSNGQSVSVAPSTIKESGNCQTFSYDKASDSYVADASGTFVKGSDNNYHSVDTASSNFSSTVAGTTTRHFVGDMETNANGAIPLKASTGSSTGSSSSVVEVESVYGQKFNAYRSGVVDSQVNTSGEQQNALNTSNARGDRFTVAATTDSSVRRAMSDRSYEKQESIYTNAMHQMGYANDGVARIADNVNQSMSIKSGRTKIVYERTVKDNDGNDKVVSSYFDVLDSSRWKSSDGSLPPGATVTEINGKKSFIVPEKSASSFKYIDNVLNNENKMG